MYNKLIVYLKSALSNLNSSFYFYHLFFFFLGAEIEAFELKYLFNVAEYANHNSFFFVIILITFLFKKLKFPKRIYLNVIKKVINKCISYKILKKKGLFPQSSIHRNNFYIIIFIY